MAILINKKTRCLIQGISGKAGRYHTEQSILYGSHCVGGVTPGKGGEYLFGIPIFDTVREACSAVAPDATIIFVPPAHAAEAILEAEDGGIPLIVCITEGIPIVDMIEVMRVMRSSKSRLIGPNCPGLIAPGESRLGIMPGYIHKKGKIGIVSRSGTLTYEAVWQTSNLNLGQSSCVGIGGDPLHGTSFVDILALFEKDLETEAILMIGEIGGEEEQLAAEWIRSHGTKPVAAFIAGSTAPRGKRMGHAGAIISGAKGSAKDKIEALNAAGVRIAATPAALGTTVQAVLMSR